jgi:hypothetical protein
MALLIFGFGLARVRGRVGVHGAVRRGVQVVKLSGFCGDDEGSDRASCDHQSYGEDDE